MNSKKQLLFVLILLCEKGFICFLIHSFQLRVLILILSIVVFFSWIYISSLLILFQKKCMVLEKHTLINTKAWKVKFKLPFSPPLSILLLPPQLMVKIGRERYFSQTLSTFLCIYVHIGFVSNPFFFGFLFLCNKPTGT